MGKATQAKLDLRNDYSNLFLKHNREVAPKAPNYALELLPYKDHFLRDPAEYKLRTKSNSREKQLIELVRYAFGKYPVCSSLTSVWFKHRIENQKEGRVLVPAFNQCGTLPIDCKLWYICVATGGSLYKQHAKEFLTKREVHYFLTCKHELTIEELLVYAIARAHTDQDGLAFRVARSKLTDCLTHNMGVFDVTMSKFQFWKTVIRFFVEHPPESINEINDLSDFIADKRREIIDALHPVQFTMAGHTLESLRKKTKDWHYELRRIKVMGNLQWDGIYVPDEVLADRDTYGTKIYWHFNQIKNSKALAAEGNRMRHCVYSYREGCAEGRLSIWSISRQEEFGVISPKLTLELKNDGTISQVRGVGNRNMKQDERSVVRSWGAKHGFTLGYYV